MDKFNLFKPTGIVWPNNPAVRPKPLTSEEKAAKEEAFRKECRDNVQKMLKAFTFDEHMQIAFTPHVIIDTIWYFVDKVQTYCIEAFKSYQ